VLRVRNRKDLRAEAKDFLGRNVNYVKMDKIKSILASASGRKPGPPVPPRPSKAAVEKALEKTRNQSPVLLKGPTQSPPVVHGRTVIYSSSPSRTVDHRPHSNNVTCETRCFDTKCDDSSTGLVVKLAQNGNSASRSSRLSEADVNNASGVNESKTTQIDNEPRRVILHHKSPVPRPRLMHPERQQTQQTQPNPKVSTVLINSPPSEANYQQNRYASPLGRIQNIPARDATVTSRIDQNKKNRDDELKEKLLKEMLERSNVVEASNKHVAYNGSSLKRSSSFDMLNELGGGSADKKEIFHNILISELSEMRRDSNPRLSSAKSSPDISQNGNANIFDMDEKKSFNTFVSLEDSGVEDEGKMDDCSSSGVGDSWDSCKEMENR
jgi:hypothetical protein